MSRSDISFIVRDEWLLSDAVAVFIRFLDAPDLAMVEIEAFFQSPALPALHGSDTNVDFTAKSADESRFCLESGPESRSLITPFCH
jgi:hypothetical protein